MAEIIELNDRENAEQISMFSMLDSAQNAEEGDGIELLAQMLLLDEEKFNAIKPVLLESFEVTFNSPAFVLQVKQAVENEGIAVDTLAQEVESWVDSLATNKEVKLSETKIDFLNQIVNMYLNTVVTVSGVGETISLPVLRIHPDAKLPVYANATDSGMDVYALEDYTIKPGETMVIPTGLKCAIPDGYEIQVRPKSGITAKTKLRVALGTIDQDYRDEIGVIIENVDPPIRGMEIDYDEDGKLIVKSVEFGRNFYIEKGQKIAQLVLAQLVRAKPYDVKDLAQFGGNRGGGFGSTGLK